MSKRAEIGIFAILKYAEIGIFAISKRAEIGIFCKKYFVSN